MGAPGNSKAPSESVVVLKEKAELAALSVTLALAMG